ncbi:MAG: DNA primase large subunit [Candidatus Methanofastidiosum methylothiophilum]|uniref:DNA primase large subunit n=1 Tax=Candidatus Methanofastidiosum methylothiophilum TaxID=1705564 RepID=A0A150IH53_9EURY|nr:MAG: DNA primase large subunit [Candidatus Methanofastidiosum methylthiophilus]
MNYELDLSNFNESKWYLPPSCEKVRSSSGTICNSDGFCKEKWYILKEKSDTKGDPTKFGEKILSYLDKTRTKEEIIEEFKDKKEVELQLKAFVRNGKIIEKGITSPFMYYLIKKRTTKEVKNEERILQKTL